MPDLLANACPWRWCRRTALIAILAAVLSHVGAVPALAQTTNENANEPQGAAAKEPPEHADWPAEERRLNTREFRRGLKRRGLTELLELHLKDFPPRDIGARLLLQREIKLAQFADKTLSQPARQDAIREANDLLSRLIELHTTDPARYEWKLELSRSLIYNEAEPYYNNILLLGGNADDRAALGPLAARAVKLLDSLREEVEREFARIDDMSVLEYERFEKSGAVEILERVAPEADYRLLWALFYDAIARPPSDPQRNQNLQRVLQLADSIDGLLDRPQEVSGVQVPALALVGMVQRRLHDLDAAKRSLRAAMTAFDQTNDSQQKRSARWANRLARIELIRTTIDSGHHKPALDAIEAFRTDSMNQPGDSFGLQLIAALLERNAYRRHAQEAEDDGDRLEAVRARTSAWRALVRLTKREPGRRNQVYATLNGMVGLDADVESLDPFEQCAMVAGLLSAAKEDDGDDELARAIAVGEHFLSQPQAGLSDLTPEVLYNLGVAHYRRNELLKAAKSFLRVGVEHAEYDRARQATLFATQLCSKIYPAFPHKPQVRALYRQSLETLLNMAPNSAEARYWLFFYAQLLEDMGEFGKAARQYERVNREHERWLDSRFFRMRCLAGELEQRTADAETLPATIQRTLQNLLAARRTLLEAVNDAKATVPPQRLKQLQRYLAESDVLEAEAYLLPRIDKPPNALTELADFESRHGDHPELIGRVLRARLIALQDLGRAQEAEALIPRFLASDAANAGPTLQSLYNSLSREVEDLLNAGETSKAKTKARTALRLAREVDKWARQADRNLTPAQKRSLQLQLAEAHLHARNFEESRERAANYLGIPGGTDPMQSEEFTAVMIYAESLFGLQKHADALPLFNRVALSLPATEQLRWKALVRDLQCRAALKESAAGIIKVIEQQQTLHPDLGGEPWKSMLEDLLHRQAARGSSGT